jgi:nicotinamidase/pyrazinamidase
MERYDPARVDIARSALIVVDVQPDFLPGGALAVRDGDRILGGVARLMESPAFPLIVATQDWHPPGHLSFASSHRGKKPFETIQLHGHDQILWPDHCVQGTPGAALHPDLPWERAAVVVRKGMHARVDTYSGFRDNWNEAGARPPTGLAGALRERGIHDVYVCGLARDVCVKWTAEDAQDADFRTYFLWDLTRSVVPDHDDAVRADLEKRDVTLLEVGA